MKQKKGNNEININSIYDYHQYPIADNESPKLSADRLEYILSNSYYYNLLTQKQIKEIYDNLIVNEKCDEIVFKNRSLAILFTQTMFKCSKIYTSDEDRYCMEYLARLLKYAIEMNILTDDDFN